MDVETALAIADASVFTKTAQHLSTLQSSIFRHAWAGQKYEQIARTCQCSNAYVKVMGAALWELLSKALGEKISKTTFRAAVERYASNHCVSNHCVSNLRSSSIDLSDRIPTSLGIRNIKHEPHSLGVPSLLLKKPLSLTRIQQVKAFHEPKTVKLAITPPLENSNHPFQPTTELEFPEGQVELGSEFYVERPPIEDHCYQAILKPGALICIKAPRQMGKTSLMVRVLHRAKQHGYHTVALNIQLADSNLLQDVNQFLRWFCVNVGRGLQLPNRLADYWDDIFGSKISCKEYFESYLLAQLNQPLMLVLDDIDHIFQYPDLVDDISALLRAWHEEAKNNDVWKKLRLVLIYSTEVSIPLNVHQSPFNVGLAIESPEFLPEQVRDLAHRHGLLWETAQVEKLMAMVGGHPYLVRVALYHIARQEMTLEQFLQLAPTEVGPYQGYLRRYLWYLKQQPEVAIVLKIIVDATCLIQLESLIVFKLHNMGLVHLKKNEVVIRCELYRQYFRDRLSCY